MELGTRNNQRENFFSLGDSSYLLFFGDNASIVAVRTCCDIGLGTKLWSSGTKLSSVFTMSAQQINAADVSF